MNKIALSFIASALLLAAGCGGGKSSTSPPQVSSSSSQSSQLASSESSSEAPASSSLASESSSSSLVSSEASSEVSSSQFSSQAPVSSSSTGGIVSSSSSSSSSLVSSSSSESFSSNEESSSSASPPIIATGLLNDTGIDWCANAYANNLPCPSEDFEGQDGEHGRDAQARAGTLIKEGGGAAGFDFTKLDNQGNDLPAGALEWSCVRDNHTGLIWEVKANDGSLRDWNHRYTWYNPDAATNGGGAGVQGGGTCTDSDCDTHAFVAAVNAQGLCGANDWYLPAPHELLTLVRYDVSSPAIDTQYFPNTQTSLSFWSSSPDAGSSYYAWVVDFNGAYAGAGGVGKNSPLYARLVRRDSD